MDGWWVYPVENFRVKDADRRKPQPFTLSIRRVNISPPLKSLLLTSLTSENVLY